MHGIRAIGGIMKDKVIKLCKKIFDDENATVRGYVIRVLCSLLLAVIVAGAFEVRCNRDILGLPKEQQGLFEVAYHMDGATYVAEFDTRYVDKVRIEYDSNWSTKFDILSTNVDTGAQYLTEDHNYAFFNVSVHRIEQEVSKIELYNPVIEEIATGLGVGVGVNVTHIYIDNRAEINYGRVILVTMFVFSVMMLVLCSKLLTGKMERMFLFVAIGMGIGYFAIVPSQKIAWDEGIHFRMAYETTLQPEVTYNEYSLQHSNDALMWRLNFTQSYEEKLLLDEFLDENISYDADTRGAVTVGHKKFKIANIGYVPSGIGLTIGRLLKLDYTDLFRLGRIFNFAAYVALAYFAIRRCKIGKVPMTLIALMPTLMSTAVAYSRDAMLNGLALLSMSYLIAMFVEKEEQISWKNYMIFAVSMFLVCKIKAIYAPLLLLVLLIPKDRFKDKKTMYIMKGGVFLIAFLLVASFMLPAVDPNNTSIGDSRGGDTSGARQMAHIFGAPVAYAKLLLTSIETNFINYTFGMEGLGRLGQIMNIVHPELLPVILFLAAILDRNDKKVDILPKLGIIAMSFVIICFVWTSMYLSFTEVGANQIAGVQGRYFIPIVYPLLLLLNTDKITVNLNRRVLNTVFIAILVFIEYHSMYNVLNTICA
ncbi:MAG: DUF2142 domain-containing protein [Lachnospiraceae bacterium]|nr:DUF2142 domain-containing protein [Lachnospiraceae bacterium]